MKLIEQIDPDFLVNIDKKSNIVMCVHPEEKESLVETNDLSDNFGICLARDLNLSANDIIKISSSALAATIRPQIKISMPVGIRIQFSDFVQNPNQDIFWKTYRSFNSSTMYDDKENLSHVFVSNMVFIMYMDTIRMREAGLQMVVKKGVRICDFYFTWYAQTNSDMPQIENIYLLSDAHVYENFVNIF